jgi:hypothetical protein
MAIINSYRQQWKRTHRNAWKGKQARLSGPCVVIYDRDLEPFNKPPITSDAEADLRIQSMGQSLSFDPSQIELGLNRMTGFRVAPNYRGFTFAEAVRRVLAEKQ